MSKNDTSLEKNTPSPKRRIPLTKKALQDMCRPHAVEAIKTMVELMNKADNDSVRLGACKTLLSKVVPDLKSEEVKHSFGEHMELLDRLFNRFDANPTDSKKTIQQ